MHSLYCITTHLHLFESFCRRSKFTGNFTNKWMDNWYLSNLINKILLQQPAMLVLFGREWCDLTVDALSLQGCKQSRKISVKLRLAEYITLFCAESARKVAPQDLRVSSTWLSTVFLRIRESVFGRTGCQALWGIKWLQKPSVKMATLALVWTLLEHVVNEITGVPSSRLEKAKN